jgi:precorrin-2/cobalt-factor-2 C20-methyltransferase
LLFAHRAELGAGRDVAFLTEGNPSLYSTFIDLREDAPRHWPEVRIEVNPGRDFRSRRSRP